MKQSVALKPQFPLYSVALLDDNRVFVGSRGGFVVGISCLDGVCAQDCGADLNLGVPVRALSLTTCRWFPMLAWLGAIHTHTHTHRHTDTHTQTHTHRHTDTQTHRHTDTHTHTHTHTLTHFAFVQRTCDIGGGQRRWLGERCSLCCCVCVSRFFRLLYGMVPVSSLLDLEMQV